MQETIRHIYLKYIEKDFYCTQRPVSIIHETLRGGGLDSFPKKNYTYRTLDLITDVQRKHVSVFHFYFIATNGNKNKKEASKTRNKFDFNTLVDHLEHRPMFTVQYRSYTNFL